jgi:hypothetical protein
VLFATSRHLDATAPVAARNHEFVLNNQETCMSTTTTKTGLTTDQIIANPILRIGHRKGGAPAKTQADLGLLASLPGHWTGFGFNLVARPLFKGVLPFFLELNATSEQLAFNAISGDIPNRGSVQEDLELHGVRYLQQVSDVSANAGIHIEPGLWIHVPAAADVAGDKESYVRQSAIPHGDSLLAQTTFFTTVPGGPVINPVDSTPFTDTTIPGLNASPLQPITNPDYLAPYLNSSLPDFGVLKGLNATATIKDPTLALKAANKGQNIVSTIVLSISTADPGALINIPFVKKNANAAQLDAIFWIETVELPDGVQFLQLQYVQRVILDFVGIRWPHISVATLNLI